METKNLTCFETELATFKEGIIYVEPEIPFPSKSACVMFKVLAIPLADHGPVTSCLELLQAIIRSQEGVFSPHECYPFPVPPHPLSFLWNTGRLVTATPAGVCLVWAEAPDCGTQHTGFSLSSCLLRVIPITILLGKDFFLYQSGAECKGFAFFWSKDLVPLSLFLLSIY